MRDKIYIGNLCNWSAVASRFELDCPEPHFVHVLLESDGDRFVELGLWSDDGHRFSFAAAEGPCRGGQERLIGPSSCSVKRLREKLVRLSPLVQPHLAEISAWRRHVGAPLDLPQVVEVRGPGAGILRVVRNGLGLSGIQLTEVLSHAGSLPVSAPEYFALQHWARMVPGVTIQRSRDVDRKRRQYPAAA